MFDPDICLCTGENCSLREKCLRYKYHLIASSDKDNYNTYFVNPPIKDGACEYCICLT